MTDKTRGATRPTILRHLLPIAAILLLTALFVTPVIAGTSGELGDGLKWELKANGDKVTVDKKGEQDAYTLTISRTSPTSGTGEMIDYASNKENTRPWYAYNSNITKIVFEGDITKIGDRCFYKLTALTTIQTKIDENTLSENGVLPNTLRIIGESAFDGCTQLTGSITLGQSLEEFGIKVFRKTGISEYKINSNNLYFTILGGILYCSKESGEKILVSCPEGKEGDLDTDWLADVTEISAYAFADEDSKTPSQITNLEIPDTVKSIGVAAFQKCTWITGTLTIPNVGTLPDNVFTGATGITDVVLSPDITSIGKDAFKSCSNLKSISWGENPKITNIGKNAFQKCGTLEITLPQSVRTVADTAFAAETKKGYTISGDFSHITSIGKQAFMNCDIKSDVVISSGTSISIQIFDGAVISNLTYYPETLPVWAFKGATIKSFKMGSTVMTVGGEPQGSDNDAQVLADVWVIDLTEMSDDVTINNGAFIDGYTGEGNIAVYVKNEDVYTNKLDNQNFDLENGYKIAVTNGGTFETYAQHSTSGTLDKPTKNGYTFSNWETGTLLSFSYSSAKWTLDAPASVTLKVDKTGIKANEPVTLTAEVPAHDLAGVTYKYLWYAGGTEESNKIEETTVPTYTNNTQTATTTYYCKVIAVDPNNGNAESAATSSDGVIVNILSSSAEVSQEDEATLLNNITGTYAAQFADKPTRIFISVSLPNDDHSTEVKFVVTKAELGITGTPKDYDFKVLHLNESTGTPVVELLTDDKVTPTDDGLEITSTLSSFVIGYGPKQLPPTPSTPSSSGSQGSSVWLMETQTPTPTPTVTPTETETAPTDFPSTQPTEEPSSPAPLLAVLAGLGAVAVLRRK